MRANVSSALRFTGTAGTTVGRPPSSGLFARLGGERRIDVHVAVHPGRHPVAAQLWERAAWLDDTVLIAESPVLHLPPGLERALRTVAADTAARLEWRSEGVAAFSLDAGTGMFRMRECAQLPQPAAAERVEFVSGNCHLLQLRLEGKRNAARRGATLLVCGVTRGDALRRAYQAVSQMRDAGIDAHLLLLRRLIASPDYCAGVTGSPLMREMLR